ncbi:MAG: RNase adapter RapZ [Rhodospirillaceae bacterium]|nr:RNase adapter RapZ [Rhodospirillaceae bacterium]
MIQSKAVRLFVITGMSGAGKSSALHAMEDLGFEAVDNLPIPLLEAVIRGGGPDRPLAIGMDVRTRDFNAGNLIAQLHALGDQPAIKTTLIYLDSDDDVLIRRYTETRRPHPLAGDMPVASAISTEREILAPIKSDADLVIDTSSMTPGDLKRQLEKSFGGKDDRPMHIHLVSFGYRNGVPREADLVFDVRFLRNPHYVDSLQPKTGLDARVGAYIADDPAFAPFVENLTKLIEPLLPRYREEGKSYLTIAIGCTGGRHRSVYTVKELTQSFNSLGIEFDFRHRDLNVEAIRAV